MSKLVERLMPEAPDALPSFPELYSLLAELLRCLSLRSCCCIMHIRYKVYGWDIQLRPTGEVDGFRQLLIMEIISTPNYSTYSS